MKKLWIAAIVCLIVTGCSMFGGAESSAKLANELELANKQIAELKTSMEVVKKDIDQSKKEYANKGDVTAFETRMSKIEDTVYNINETISNIQTNIINIQSQISVQNNEPFWKIVLPLGIFYLLASVIKHFLYRKK